MVTQKVLILPDGVSPRMERITKQYGPLKSKREEVADTILYSL